MKQNSFNACGVPINFANCRPLTQHVKLLVPATSTACTSTCTSLPSRRRPSTICLFLTFQRQFRRMSGGKTAVTLLRLTTIISTLCTALTFTPSYQSLLEVKLIQSMCNLCDNAVTWPTTTEGPHDKSTRLDERKRNRADDNDSNPR